MSDYSTTKWIRESWCTPIPPYDEIGFIVFCIRFGKLSPFRRKQFQVKLNQIINNKTIIKCEPFTTEW